MSLENLNRFERNAVDMNMQRSKLSMPFNLTTTFNSAEINPYFCAEVLPGDTWSIDLSEVCRLLSPAVPVMSNAYADFYFFFVPSRLCCQKDTDWQEVMGENINGFWAPQVEKDLNNTGNTFAIDGVEIMPQSMANLMGLPIFKETEQANLVPINTLPFRGFTRIYNDWFRDQNVEAPIEFNMEDFLDNSKNYTAYKFHDYFTSALPAPQKGISPLLPLSGLAPLTTGIVHDGLKNMTWHGQDSLVNRQAMILTKEGVKLNINDTPEGEVTDATTYPNNLYADLSDASSASIAQLRLGVAVQRILEKDARGGSRYTELLRTHFNINIPDAFLQRSEYITGKRIPINIQTVVQTSETTDNNPLGTIGAYSHTSSNDSLFTKSFMEYGYLYGVCVIRPEQVYAYGIPAMFRKIRRFDFYWPSLSHIGEVPIYNSELYMSDANGDKNFEVFGYREAWNEYRYLPSRIAGYVAPNSGDTLLESWTYAEKLSTLPTLNKDFLKCNKTQIGDTLVSSDTKYQFLVNIHLDCKVARPLPVNSIPGLIDHF